jgi:hypothetical protein
MIRHIIRHSHSATKRGWFSFFIVACVMAIGTVGMHRLEYLPWLEAFYFMSMIATGQGPIYTPVTSAGMVFVSVMAFVSVGTVVAALGFLFGPFFGQLWHIGRRKLEEEIHLLKKEKR